MLKKIQKVAENHDYVYRYNLQQTTIVVILIVIMSHITVKNLILIKSN